LCVDGTHRYGELKKKLVGITHKMLSKCLKELESNDLINRKSYNVVPPKVEYSISKKGETLLPVLKEMHK
jgi:DNA-binding HxlR family transcriptional regulator